MVLGQLLSDNLCYGASSLVRIVWRVLEKSPCNGGSHIATLGFYALKLLRFHGSQ